MGKAFSVGDCVYVASYGNQQEDELCPVCFGKRKVTVILGDDSEVVTPCRFCSCGYDPPTGTVKVYAEKGRVTPHTITSVETSTTAAGVTHEYHSDLWYFTDANTFATSDEAQVEADRLAAEHKKQQDQRAEYIKANVHRDFSWNAGYHLREARDLRERAERHEKLAVVCKARARTKRKGNQ